MQKAGKNGECESDPQYNRVTSEFRSDHCELWFDVARTSMPRPFRRSYGEEDFRNLRSERKWFKNIQVRPFDLAQLVFTDAKIASPERVRVSCGLAPKLPNPEASLAFCSGYVIDEGDARRVLLRTAECFGLTIKEMRDACENGGGLEDLGLDSLMVLELYSSLCSSGISPPIPLFDAEHPDGKTFFYWIYTMVDAFGDEIQAPMSLERNLRLYMAP